MTASSSNYFIAQRYANSLFTNAYEAKHLKSVLADLKYLQELLQKSIDFKEFMTSVVINTAKKKQVWEVVAKKSTWDGLTVAFVHLLIENRREAFLSEIIKTFLKKYDEVNGIEKVEIISSSSLSAADVNAIIQKISKQKRNTLFKKIKPILTVDSSFIGGFVIKRSDTIVDYSLKGRLHIIREHLLQ